MRQWCVVRGAWCVIFCAGIAMLASAFFVAEVRSAAAPLSEPEVKATYILNFARFVEWPADAFARTDSPIVIGIVGKDPFGSAIDRRLKGGKVNGRPFEVRRIAKWGAEIKQCHILFVSASEKNIRQMLELLKDAPPVLTIGETPGFARRGGIINFVFEDEKLSFEINVEAAKKARLTMSSGLLNLARKIVTS